MGLGNPGPDYQDTRHNAGFWFLDQWAGICGLSFRKPWFRPYSFCSLKQGQDRLVLVKPLTFVNRSGTIVPRLLSEFAATAVDLLVVFDQMDLPPGRVRLKPHGSSAGHNGLKSVDEALGGGFYHRLAIGVGRPVLADRVVDHVLGVLSSDDQNSVRKVIETTVNLVHSHWRAGWEPLIHVVNQRNHPSP